MSTESPTTAARPHRPVLVAHGREIVAAAVCRVLARAGFTPVRAGSAEDALRLAAAGTFGAVVADQSLEGGGGASLLARIRQLRPGARRVLVTSCCDAPSQGSLRAAEADRLLPKPFGAAELLASLEASGAGLGGRGSAAPPAGRPRAVA